MFQTHLPEQAFVQHQLLSPLAQIVWSRQVEQGHALHWRQNMEIGKTVYVLGSSFSVYLPRGQELSQQRTDQCKGCCIYSLGMARVCVVGRSKRQPRALWAMLGRAWVLSSRHQTASEEIPKQKWQDQGLFSKDWSGSGVAKREKALLLHCLKTTVPVLLAATKSFLKVGTSSKCRSGITMPGICIDPFASKTLSFSSSNNNMRRWAKQNHPHPEMGKHLQVMTEAPKYSQLEQMPSSSALFKTEI